MSDRKWSAGRKAAATVLRLPAFVLLGPVLQDDVNARTW